MFSESGLGEVFGGLAGTVGGAEVGGRIFLTLLVLVGAFALRRVVARRRFGTTGERGGTTTTAPTGSASSPPTPCGGWRGCS